MLLRPIFLNFPNPFKEFKNCKSFSLSKSKLENLSITIPNEGWQKKIFVLNSLFTLVAIKFPKLNVFSFFCLFVLFPLKFLNLKLTVLFLLFNKRVFK